MLLSFEKVFAWEMNLVWGEGIPWQWSPRLGEMNPVGLII